MNRPIAEAFHNALATLQAGCVPQAHDLFAEITKHHPGNADAWFLRALCQSQMGKKHDAIASNEIVIRLNPEFVEAYINRGADLVATGQFKAAEADLEQAVALNSQHPQAYLNLGNVYRETDRLGAAESAFEKSVKLMPGYVDAWCNLADARCTLGNVSGAIAAGQEALRIDPVSAQAFNVLGLIYTSDYQTDRAIGAFEEAIRSNSQYTAAYNNLALVLMNLKQLKAAKAVLEEALRLEPQNAAVNNNLGNLLINLGEPGKAIERLQVAYGEDPTHQFVTGALLHAKMKVCDWRALDQLFACALQPGEVGSKYAQVFTLLATPSTSMQQKSCAQYYVSKQFSRIKPICSHGEKPAQKKIRVAYLSADFFNHATAFLMAELFELHDRSRFEIIGICYGRQPEDEMRLRISQSFDQFYEVSEKSDHDIAAMVHELNVDIAVDLKGHTTDSRLGILAYRPAPIQIHYLGYPGTTGASFIDYLIADPVLIPPEHRQYYTEKIAYLPDCYQVNDSQRQISNRFFTRDELGLPDAGFVFCSFNNNFKITPDLFDVWMRLLKRVDGSVLWLFQANPEAAANLRKEALARDVDPNRLIFAEQMPLAEHLARHRCADLFLDTWYYNAHTTASDALWTGLPIVTKLGDTFAGRVAASLLTAINLPELITHTTTEYEALAFELASNPEKLSGIKDKLKNNRSVAPLFDTKRFAGNLEQVYEQMLQRYQRGLPPDHVSGPSVA